MRAAPATRSGDPWSSEHARPAHPSDGLRALTLGGRVILLYFVGFLLIFPKGGIKLAGVPLTWGYLGMALIVLWFVARLFNGHVAPVLRTRLLVLTLLAPFQMIAWLAFVMNGIGDFGFAISFLVTFFVVPVVFVLILGTEHDRIDLSPLLTAVRRGILIIAIYGIFLFVYKLLTGAWIEIPYLTVNAGDVGTLDDKHIDRGGVFKLISTYNNGNVYGVSLLILLPLYVWLESSRVKQGAVKFSLLLTLSRTVWIGLLLAEILQRVYVRRASFRSIAALLSMMGGIALGVWYMLGLFGANTSFLLDRSLGGRVAQLGILEEMRLFAREEFHTITEMVYLSVLNNFGMIGLIAFIVAMTGPVVLHFIGGLPGGESAYKRSLVSGLLVYLVVAMSDGAILYIPVMAFYWFVVSLLLSGNPSFLESAGGRRKSGPSRSPAVA